MESITIVDMLVIAAIFITIGLVGGKINYDKKHKKSDK